MKVLISNRALPSSQIGSWTTRMDRLIAEADPFDLILSPSPSSGKFVHCKKRRFRFSGTPFRKKLLMRVVARDYVDKITAILRRTDKVVTAVVMDDPHLAEAMTFLKDMNPGKLRLVYSFHGFELKLDQTTLNKIDKVLFLTNSAYQASRARYFSFVPESAVVGVSVPEIFRPLKQEEKLERKISLGFNPDRPVICWLGNDRPIKGKHIFYKACSRLKDEFPELQFLVIGSDDKLDLPNSVQPGRISNTEVPYYLQAGDFFLFTTLCQEGFGLSMVEALRTGNFVLASGNGSVQEILNGIRHSIIVERPNIVEAWVSSFHRTYKNWKLGEKPSMRYDQYWQFSTWKEDFLSSIDDEFINNKEFE